MRGYPCRDGLEVGSLGAHRRALDDGAAGGMGPAEACQLSAWCEEWWARHAVPNLERQTRTSYKQQWGKWIQPRLGDYELRAFTPRVVAARAGDAQGRRR